MLRFSKSFSLASFECLTHRRRSARRLDLIAALRRDHVELIIFDTKAITHSTLALCHGESP
jgi:hypothetical protein